jgi:hypothetical protein
VVAPIVTGVLNQRTGSRLPAFVVAVVILHMALPAYWWMVGEKKEQSSVVSYQSSVLRREGS